MTVRGRVVFRRMRPLLYGLSSLFKLMPRVFRHLCWSLSDLVPGMAGVGLRYAIARSLAAHCGDVVLFGPGVTVKAWRNLSLGNNVSIHDACYIDATGCIDIHDEVSIAHHTSVLSSNHTWDDPSLAIRDNPVTMSKTTIGPDVWIGCGVRVLAGVHLGARTVVAAGAVVNRSFEGNGLLGGVPARVLKRIDI